MSEPAFDVHCQEMLLPGISAAPQIDAKRIPNRARQAAQTTGGRATDGDGKDGFAHGGWRLGSKEIR